MLHGWIKSLSALACVYTCVFPCISLARNDFSIGVEGFSDRYIEFGIEGAPKVKTNYTSVDARYINTSKDGLVSEIDLRGSYGHDRYKSAVSGTLNGVPQYEGEVRLLGGATIAYTDLFMVPYFGLGVRAFLDAGKGYHASTGAAAYDRRIMQFYVPLGTSFSRTFNGWTYNASLEFDPLLIGLVNSRLQNDGHGDSNLRNTQHHGYGLRGEFLMGQKYQYVGWELGPFFRFWDINDSDTAENVKDGKQYIEPKNTRLQVGIKGRVNF